MWLWLMVWVKILTESAGSRAVNLGVDGEREPSWRLRCFGFSKFYQARERTHQLYDNWFYRNRRRNLPGSYRDCARYRECCVRLDERLGRSSALLTRVPLLSLGACALI